MEFFKRLFGKKVVEEYSTTEDFSPPPPEKVLDISEPVLSMVEVLETAPLNRFTVEKKYYFGGIYESRYEIITIKDKLLNKSWQFRWEYNPYTRYEGFIGLEYFTKDEINLLEDKLKRYFGRKLQRKQELKKQRLMRKRDELVKLYCKEEVK